MPALKVFATASNWDRSRYARYFGHVIQHMPNSTAVAVIVKSSARRLKRSRFIEGNGGTAPAGLAGKTRPYKPRQKSQFQTDPLPESADFKLVPRPGLIRLVQPCRAARMSSRATPTTSSTSPSRLGRT